MTVPSNTVNVTVNQSGQVSVTLSNQTEQQQIGQITLANFANDPGYCRWAAIVLT
jgi:flagellar basal-body rod protein FlgG